MKDPQFQYKQTQISTATPAQLLLMLYDAAIVSMETAIRELNEKRKVKRYDVISSHLIKVQEILGELLSTLDLKQGGEIATNLQSLYSYCIKQIMEANLEKKAEPVKEVLGYMKELKESWEVAVKKTSVTNAQPKKLDSPPEGNNLNISG